MIKIIFPDNSVKNFEKNITGFEIAKSISNSLAKEAIVMKVNEELWDLNRPIDSDSSIEIITKKQPEALEIIRHDTAHLLAQAVKQIFPETQVTIGPAIENGFYYDFYRKTPFVLDDLAKIEKRMKLLVDQDIKIERELWSRNNAIEFFHSIGEKYKAEIIEDIPEKEEISLYRQGDFLDLCRGPHCLSTGKIGKNFKLMKLAGSYWRGDSRNVSLQRVYGTAWATEKQLNEYLEMLAEAEKRDHRKLGNQLELFHLQEESPGGVFWHHKGWTIYKNLRNYIRKKLEQNNYIEVNTPILVDRKFWENSGHWDKYRENMFTTDDSDNNNTMAMKPMNCPCHVQIFKKGIKSYRDLPLRMAEFGSCHRNEPSGALHGLMRVRAFTQDDAHIFCTKDQIISETKSFCSLLKEVYSDLGFSEVSIKFSDRPEVRAGSDETWDNAENALLGAIKETGLTYTLNPGDGAFYGPKIDFILKDAIGREWQCGTLQVDFVLPERLDANYIDENGNKQRPVMLHRAILGSFERFIAILIENYSGKMPLWLSPLQVGIVPISETNNKYADEICNELKKYNIRAEVDARNEKMNYKIREFFNAKTPVIFTVGRQEEDKRSVSMRYLGSKEQKVIAFTDALEDIKKKCLSPIYNKTVGGSHP